MGFGNCLASPMKTATNSTNYQESRIVWLASREIILRENSWLYLQTLNCSEPAKQLRDLNCLHLTALSLQIPQGRSASR
jgi:hypothetical protein